VARVRELISGWFGRLPPPVRDDLRPRLRSAEDDEFLAAFWELYLAGGAPPHRRRPGVPSPAREQFSAARLPCDRAIGLLPRGHTRRAVTGGTRADARLTTLYDLLNRASLRDFIDVDVEVIRNRPSPAGSLRRQIDSWIGGLDPGALIDGGVTFDAMVQHEFRWRWEDWDVTFRPIPKSASHRGRWRRSAYRDAF
jgi:hypothetical protein